jgi:hypothetical protein
MPQNYLKMLVGPICLGLACAYVLMGQGLPRQEPQQSVTVLGQETLSHDKPNVPIPPRANCSSSGDVIPGQQWRLNIPHEGPWQAREMRPVTVVDVKDGWVRYDHWPAGKYYFSDTRREIRAFTEAFTCVPLTP